MAVKFVGRDGRECQRVEWNRLRADDSYRVVRLYDNGAVFIELEWSGKIDNPDTFRDCWKVFKLNVQNYDSTGARRPDPVEDGRTFPTEAEAVAGYEKFLERWTNSHRDEHGDFVEEDNTLAPPKPPDPDEPTTVTSSIKLGIEDDGVGAW